VEKGKGGRSETYHFDVVDEEVCNRDLGAHVAELRGHTPEEDVLLVQWLVLVSSLEVSALLFTVGHIGVGNFGNGSEVEDNCEEEDEAAHREVGPLYGFQGRAVGFVEEHTGSEERRNDCADGLERLGEVQSEFRVPGWTTGCNKRVRRGFEGR